VKLVLILLPILFFPSLSSACRISNIGNYIGYTIVSSHRVTGHINDDGEEESSYLGCSYGRVLIIDNNKQVTCQDYGYSYAYRPEMVLLSKGSSLIACIKDDVFNIR